MALEVLDRRLARLVVAARVQRDPVPPGDARVARGQLGPGTAEREVDVEENGPQGHSASSSSHLTVSTLRLAVVAVERPRHRLPDRPAAGALAVEAELGRQPVEAVEHVCLRGPSSTRAHDRRDRELALTDRAASDRSRATARAAAARTLSPWRSWCSSTCSPCDSTAAAARRPPRRPAAARIARPDRSHCSGRSSIHQAASSASVSKRLAGSPTAAAAARPGRRALSRRRSPREPFPVRSARAASRSAPSSRASSRTAPFPSEELERVRFVLGLAVRVDHLENRLAFRPSDRRATA